jgi:tRNA (cmo5U34)-methyltransferase
MSDDAIHAWQDPDLVRRFVTGLRARIPLAQEQLQVMMHVVGRAVPDVGCFLDVGCGGGILSQVMRERYPQAEAVLVDYSDPMLDIARANFVDTSAEAQANAPKTHIYKQDIASEMWLDDVKAHAPYDVIVSGYAIHHLTHRRKRELYAEIHDLLREGGIFINVEHVASPTAWVEDLFNHAYAEGIYALRQEEGKPMPYEQIMTNLRQDDGDICATAEEQCEWLREMGYQHVDIYMKIYSLAVFGGIR